ncbi:uncharacterized membrane protein HdeD (DUF308 family) [Flavobacterium arsenatis]|uniref:Uncharacterized membrane protein HdeD (DUF308 family) n=1 Tax=Flavobacterium arsenatis TaxID=1484332 RepID=A0ABU1TQM5_9FLAO|nr:uncharacterized membrane protein HdeD (DUF308 family) [Flavobacterium arsenatis]
MQKNLNRKDGLIRAILGFCAIALFFFNPFDDTLLEMIFGIIGLVLIISAVIEFCPIYYFLGIKTRQKRRKKFY